MTTKSKSVTVSVRLRPETLEQLRRAALADRRTMSSFMTVVVERAALRILEEMAAEKAERAATTRAARTKGPRDADD